MCNRRKILRSLVWHLVSVCLKLMSFLTGIITVHVRGRAVEEPPYVEKKRSLLWLLQSFFFSF